MKFKLYKDRNKQWRWTLYAKNGRKIANAGEGYRRRIDCGRIIEKLILHIGEAAIE